MRYYLELLVVLILFIALSFLLPQAKQLSNIGSIGTRSSGEQPLNIQSNLIDLSSCVLDRNKLAALCCKTDDGVLYDCGNKANFLPGEYLIVKLNAQKALQGLGPDVDLYKICGFSQLRPDSDSYQSRLGFSKLSDSVFCSSTFNKNDFHEAALYGFVPNSLGSTNIAEWRIYDNNIDTTNLESVNQNYDSSISVFQLEVNVGE